MTQKFKYSYPGKFNPAKLSPDNIDRLSTSLIPRNSKILELGCATGFMSQYFTDSLGCQVYGVELDSTAARKAAKYTRGVIVGNLDDHHTWKQIKKQGQFEVVFASSVIEHTRDPWTILNHITKVLKPGGQLIITTPNIAHWRARLHLLSGHWDYQDFGTFDNTHLRFFTYHSFQHLVTQAGLTIKKIDIDPAGGIKYFNWLAKHFPNFYAHQVVISATKS